MSRKGRFIETDSASVVAWVWGAKAELSANRLKGIFWSDGNGLNCLAVMAANCKNL